MRFQKGHKFSVGNKGGGRKSIAEEVESVRLKLKAEATEEAIKELAKNQVYNSLDNSGLKFEQVKEMALPIVLKSMVEKKQLSGELKVLSMDDSVKEKYEVAPNTNPSCKGTK